MSNVPAEQASYRNVCHWFGGYVTEDFKKYNQ